VYGCGAGESGVLLFLAYRYVERGFVGERGKRYKIWSELFKEEESDNVNGKANYES